MIQVRHLSAGYSKRGPKTIRDFSFEVKAGGTLTLLGPNGSGKSTLLKALLGLLPYTEGEILIDGKNIREMSIRERAHLVAYVPQTVDLVPMSVYEFVMLGRLGHFRFAPGKEDHEAVESALESLGIQEFKDRNVLELSGGEAQRAAIARTLAQEAKVLILDEPTSNLDITAERAVVSIVKELSKNKDLTFVLSMHDINLALSVGDHFALLQKGNLISYGGKEVISEENLKKAFGVLAKTASIDGREYIIWEGET